MLPPRKDKPAHFSWPPWLAFMLTSSIALSAAIVFEVWRRGGL